MSKNPKAKKLASSFNLPYAQALGVVRDESELAEEMADHLNMSIRDALDQLATDYPVASQRAAAEGVSFRTALNRIREEQARQRRYSAAAAAFPTVEQLLRRNLVGACEDLSDQAVARDDQDNFAVSGLAFDGVDLPDDVEDIEIDVIVPDLNTLIWNEVEVMEGETYIGTVEVRAEAVFAGFMHRGDTYTRDDITVIVADWNERTSQVGFRRDVVMEFNATVIPGAETVEMEFVSATADELPVDPHSIVG